ncbi:MAG TPA: sugar phosphate nucleotidyltransferase, partial [Syntrophorhabdales bacterium]|nr:sugar phosphate nucleotidyltransferase [Syntrophorhabdales bacterium]
ADLTIAFTPMPNEGPDRFGQGLIEGKDPTGGRLIEYVEKPQKRVHDWASLTIYVFNQRVLLEVLEENANKDSHEFGRDIIPSLIGKAMIHGYKHTGYWGYTRTLEEYWRTSMALLGDPARIDLKSWQIRTNLAHREIRDRQPTIFGPASSVKDSLVHSGCHVRGKVSRSLLFPGVVVEEGAVVEDSILFFDTKVAKEARVTRTIADIGVAIGRCAAVGGRDGKLTVIGMESSLPEEVKVHDGVTIYPNVAPDHFTQRDYGSGEIVK